MASDTTLYLSMKTLGNIFDCLQMNKFKSARESIARKRQEEVKKQNCLRVALAHITVPHACDHPQPSNLP
jgi:hypothetical protein